MGFAYGKVSSRSCPRGQHTSDFQYTLPSLRHNFVDLSFIFVKPLAVTYSFLLILTQIVHSIPRRKSGLNFYTTHDRFYPERSYCSEEFDAEAVDEAGNSIPLHEVRVEIIESIEDLGVQRSDYEILRISGVCQNDTLKQYFGLGSETRKMSTHVPDPYGIEVGNPADIFPGYEEKWLLNVHAIDTREVEDKLGCTECRCDLYNVMKGWPDPNYKGGLYCCHDQLQCWLTEGRWR